MQKLYYIEINENIDASVFNQLLLLTSIEKRQKISQYRFDIDKKLCLYSDVLIRCLACLELKSSNEQLEFYTNDYGKPYLMGYQNFQFNSSHTKNAIAAGISKNPLGVDIEKIKSLDLNIAKRFFTENELHYILLDTNNQDQRFFEIWTQKEAYIKYIGKGLAIPLKSFDVTHNILKDKISALKIDNYIISAFSGLRFRNNDVVQISESEISFMAMSLLKS